MSVGQINLTSPLTRRAGKLHHECRRIRRSQHNSLLRIYAFPGELAGSDATMKDCITNLDELAEANSATYKMILLRITLPNEPASSSQLRQPAVMKLLWILSNQVLVQFLCSVLSSWPTKWNISMVPACVKTCRIRGVMGVHGFWARGPEFTDRQMESGYEDGKNAVRVTIKWDPATYVLGLPSIVGGINIFWWDDKRHD